MLNGFNDASASISVFDSGGPIFGDGTSNGTGNGVTFAPTGLSLASAHSDPDNPFERQFGTIDYTPMGLRALDKSNNSFNFRFDLVQMAQGNANGKDGLGQNPLDPAPPPSPFKVWVAGQYLDFKDKQTNADRDGHVWWMIGGLGYKIGQRTTIGAFTRVRQGEMSSNAMDAKLDSKYWGGGAFLLQELGYGVRVMGSVLYEVGDNSIIISGDTGTFDSDQISYELRTDKRFNFGRHWIEPAVKVSYQRHNRNAYTDSAGLVIASSVTKLGRLTYGPKVGTTLGSFGNISAIKPFAKINGIWDFEHADPTTLSTGVIVASASTAVNLGGGIEVAFVNGTAFNFSGDWTGFNTELSSWSVNGGLGVPMAAFGLFAFFPNGFISLKMTAAEMNMGATAKLTVKWP